LPTIVARVLAILSVVPALLGGWAAFEQHRRVTGWTPVAAEVVRSEAVVRRTRGSPETRVALRYRYEAGGVTHEAERIYPGPLGSGSGDPELLVRFPVGARTTARHHPRDPARAFLLPEHGFLPYLVFLAASPLAALAAGVATGGVRFVSSREREVPPPRETEAGWWEVEVFRPWLALRASAAAAFAVFGAFGLVAFGHYLAVAPRPGALAVLALLGWLALLARLAWAVVKRTLVARTVREARVTVRPLAPSPGAAFHVRVQQAVRRETRVRALEASLIAERTELRRRGTRKKVVFRDTATLLRDTPATSYRPLLGEHAFSVPPTPFHEGGFVRWRVEVRTRLAGPDYRTRFPLAEPDEEED